MIRSNAVNKSRRSITASNLSTLAGIADCFCHFINDSCLQFVCISCHQQFYRNQVRVVTEKIKVLLQTSSEFAGIVLKQSVESKVWICSACDRHIKAGKVPPESVVNGFTYPTQPLALRDASLLEERLVSPRTAFINVLERPSGGQLSCRGGIVSVPNSLKHALLQANS